MKKRHLFFTAFMACTMIFSSTSVYAAPGNQDEDTADQLDDSKKKTSSEDEAKKDDNEKISDELNDSDDKSFYSDADDNMSEEAKDYLHKDYDENDGSAGGVGSGSTVLLEWAEATANDDEIGYSQDLDKRVGPNFYDCSSFASAAAGYAGVSFFQKNQNMNCYEYDESGKRTGEKFKSRACSSSDIGDALKSSGWEEHKFNASTYKSDFQPGDIVVAPHDHVTIIDSVEGGNIIEVAAHTYKRSLPTQISICPFTIGGHSYKHFYRSPVTEGELGDGNNYDKVWNYLNLQSEVPLTKQQVAGMMGNFAWETGGAYKDNNGTFNHNEDINPKSTSGGLGIAQMTDVRASNLKKFAEEKGKDWTDLEVQLQYILHELKTSEKDAYNHLKTAKTAKDAGNIWMNYFERNKDRTQNRGDTAEQIYVYYKNKSLTKTKLSKGIKVAIDAGHPSDGKAHNPGDYRGITDGERNERVGLYEYKYTQDVALKVQKTLQDKGYNVLMTRTATDKTEHSNGDRAEAANNFGANAYLRIHVNGDTSKKPGYLVVNPNKYYSGEVKAESAKLNKKVLAACRKYMTGRVHGNDITEKLDGSSTVTMPVTLIEVGNGENDAEARWLLKNKNKVAKACAYGLINYLGKPKGKK